MSLANFKLKRTAAVSCDYLATARISCNDTCSLLTCTGSCYHAGPTVWNSLPDELRNSDTFDGFKRFLKTILFSRY